MEEAEYEQYGLSEEEWEALSEEDREAYRAIGAEPNMNEETREEA